MTRVPCCRPPAPPAWAAPWARVAARFGRSLLELGGNNAIHRRALGRSGPGAARHRLCGHGHGRPALHHAAPPDRAQSVYDQLVAQLIKVYGNVQVGDPRTEGTLVGPLIDRMAFDGMQKALEQSRALGAKVHGGAACEGLGGPDAYYVRPALVELPAQKAPRCTKPLRPSCTSPVQHAGRSHRHEQRRGRRACRRPSSR
jgi:aldehyde dehydrogenase (NAD+)